MDLDNDIVARPTLSHFSLTAPPRHDSIGSCASLPSLPASTPYPLSSSFSFSSSSSSIQTARESNRQHDDRNGRVSPTSDLDQQEEAEKHSKRRVVKKRNRKPRSSKPPRPKRETVDGPTASKAMENGGGGGGGREETTQDTDRRVSSATVKKEAEAEAEEQEDDEQEEEEEEDEWDEICRIEEEEEKESFFSQPPISGDLDEFYEKQKEDAKKLLASVPSFTRSSPSSSSSSSSSSSIRHLASFPVTSKTQEGAAGGGGGGGGVGVAERAVASEPGIQAKEVRELLERFETDPSRTLEALKRQEKGRALHPTVNFSSSSFKPRKEESANESLEYKMPSYLVEALARMPEMVYARTAGDMPLTPEQVSNYIDTGGLMAVPLLSRDDIAAVWVEAGGKSRIVHAESGLTRVFPSCVRGQIRKNVKGSGCMGLKWTPATGDEAFVSWKGVVFQAFMYPHELRDFVMNQDPAPFERRPCILCILYDCANYIINAPILKGIGDEAPAPATITTTTTTGSSKNNDNSKHGAEMKDGSYSSPSSSLSRGFASLPKIMPFRVLVETETGYRPECVYTNDKQCHNELAYPFPRLQRDWLKLVKRQTDGLYEVDHSKMYYHSPVPVFQRALSIQPSPSLCFSSSSSSSSSMSSESAEKSETTTRTDASASRIQTRTNHLN